MSGCFSNDCYQEFQASRDEVVSTSGSSLSDSEDIITYGGGYYCEQPQCWSALAYFEFDSFAKNDENLLTSLQMNLEFSDKYVAG